MHVFRLVIYYRLCVVVMQTNRTVFAPLDFSEMNWAFSYSRITAHLSRLTIMDLCDWVLWGRFVHKE